MRARFYRDAQARRDRARHVDARRLGFHDDAADLRHRIPLRRAARRGPTRSVVARERAVGYASLWRRDPRRLTRPSRRDGDRRGPVVARARARADAPRRGRRAARLAARGAAWESVVLARPCRDGASPRRITRIGGLTASRHNAPPRRITRTGRSHSAEHRECHITHAACPQAWPCTPVALFMWDGEVRDRTVRRATSFSIQNSD